MLDAATGAVLAERAEPIGVETNNVAEYRGLIAGLQAAQELGAQRVAVRMDSKLVVEQMTRHAGRSSTPACGRWPARRRSCAPAFAEISFEWIPREQNKHADRLANEAMDRAAGKLTPRRCAEPTAGSWTPPTGPRTRLVLVRHGATAHSAEHRLLRAATTCRSTRSARRRPPPWPSADSARSRRSSARRCAAPRRPRQAIAEALGLPVEYDDDFAELDFGAFEGLTFAEARERYPDELAAWTGSPDVAPPGGESFAALAAGCAADADAIVANFPDVAGRSWSPT